MVITTILSPLTSLSPELKKLLKEATDRRLRQIINANITTRFAVSSSALVDFRLAVADKDIENDATILDDFRRQVRLTDYESYHPFIVKFMERPCKLSEVENLLAPGIPDFLFRSSSTSGKEPKFFPKSCQSLYDPLITNLRPSGPGKIMQVYSINYKELLEVVTDSGEVVHTITSTVSSCGRWRTSMNWTIETDDTRMTYIVPGHVAPWATSFITHHRPFLLIHALFALADPQIEQIRVLYITIFMDIIQCIQEDWELLLSSIRDGTIPDVGHIDHVQAYLQGHLHADAKRAEELRKIGPPLSCSGWAQCVWPTLKVLRSICSGTFASAIPKARAVLGQSVTVHDVGYGCTEGLRGKALNFGDAGDFFIEIEDIVEFLDVTDKQTTDSIVQAWDLQPGKLYQPVYTCKDGLWRYVIDDILQAVGFHPRNGLPVFKFFARKNLAIRLIQGVINEVDLVSVIQAINRQGAMEVNEFTTILDYRASPPTVGFFLEITEDVTGVDAQPSKQAAIEAFLAISSQHRIQIDIGGMRAPTIRIVKPGTFMEYRRWKVDSGGVGISQVKVPVVMWDSNALQWMAERVVREL